VPLISIASTAVCVAWLVSAPIPTLDRCGKKRRKNDDFGMVGWRDSTVSVGSFEHSQHARSIILATCQVATLDWLNDYEGLVAFLQARLSLGPAYNNQLTLLDCDHIQCCLPHTRWPFV
jgi:hypothetical protein